MQLSLIRGWRLEDAMLKAVTFEEAFHYQGMPHQGMPLVPGIIAVGVTGVFTWAQMDYNLITSGCDPGGTAP